MTADDWLACADPREMLEALEVLPRSVRKLRLFCCACGRTVWRNLSRINRDLIAWQEDNPDEAPDEGRFKEAGWLLTLRGVSNHPDSPVGAAVLVPRFRKCGRGASAPSLLHCVLGNPFRPATVVSPSWLTPTVLDLAQGCYDNRALPSGHLDHVRLKILADSLEEAGCTGTDVLAHLRAPGPHVRGCWAVDLILGKS